MPKFTGKNCHIELGGTKYYCVNGMRITGGVQIPEIECSASSGNAVTHKAVGAESWTVTATIVLDSASTTVLSAFTPGTSAAFNAYPENSTASGGFAKYAWTTAYVNTHDVGSGPSGFGTLDVSVACDGAPTISAT